MSLKARLLVFFLATLGVILGGFSATLFGFASEYLHRQADERLEAVLNTLAAAAEINAEGVEWEPAGRKLSFGRKTVEGQFLWVVADSEGRRIDGSPPADDGPPWSGLIATASRHGRPATALDPLDKPWRVMAQRLEAPPGALEPETDADPKEAAAPAVHPALILGAAVSLSGAREALRNLATMLVVLSTATWTIALLIGGRLCRGALRPVSEMAEAARAIAGNAFDERLPVPATGDELEGLGRAFNGLLERQHESHERQRRFTGDASHQLRTPLTAIQGHVDLALRQDRPIDEYRHVLEVVQKKTRHLRRIVEALLFLARADLESRRPTLATIDLADWLRDHLSSWAGPRRDDLRIETTGDEPLTIDADPTLLGELLDNLLDNACKYSEPGTPIVVRADRSGDSARLSVEDRGIGIAEGDVPRVAEPFYRSSTARDRDARGLGLGLSVAARIAETFGGRLEIASRPGLGSTFTVALPAAIGTDHGEDAAPPVIARDGS